MECGQHTAQSKQPASERRLSTLSTTLLQDHIDLQCSTPGKGRDSVKLTALSTEIPRNTQNREEAQFLAAPTMHQTQPNGSIKDYLKHTDMNKEYKLKTSKEKHPEG